MMRSLKDYLIESKQEYEYRIKIAGELTEEQIERMERGFEAFDMISLSEPKRLPVQESPIGFEGVKNMEVHIMDAKFNYPASTEAFTEICRQAGIAGSNVIVLNKAFEDSMMDEEGRKDEGDEALLNSDLPDDHPAVKDAVKEYGTEGKDKDVIKNAARTEYEFVSKEIAPKAETTNDLPQGTEGPLTNVELPDLPKTGRR